MVITNDAKNRVRDLIANDITTMELGTTSTNATASDTSLGSTIVDTIQVPTITLGNKTITVTHNLNTATANGLTIAEGGIFMNSGSVLLDRFVFPPVDKTESISMTTIDVLRVD